MEKTPSVVSYLETYLLPVIKNDLIKVLKFHEKVGYGFHSISLQAFCYIDHLGALLHSEPAGSSKAVKYIEDYMGQVNSRYQDIGRLLYVMWRHGTVHEHTPKQLIHSCRRYRISWVTGKSSNQQERDCHLKCFKVQGTKNSYAIVVNLFQLSEDLVSSIKILLRKLKADYRLRRRVQKHFKQILKPRLVDRLDRTGLGVKRRLNLQIKNAVNGHCGEIDKKGRVL